MADEKEIKRIFKNKIIRQPQFQKVLRNRISGVSGVLISNSISEEKALYQVTQVPNINVSIEEEFTHNPYPHQNDIRTYKRIDVLNGIQLNINVKFQVPTYISRIKIDAIFEKTSFYSIMTGDFAYIPNTVINTVRELPFNRKNLSAPIGWESVIAPVTELVSRTIYDNPISNPNLFEFLFSDFINISGDYTQSNIMVEALTGYLMMYSGNITGSIRTGYSYYPTYITITLIGKEITSSAQTFLIGESTNAFSFPQNSLLTTKATYNGIPLNQFLSNEIINEWHDGKQITNLTKIINDNPDIENAGTAVKVMNTRKENFVDDSQSFSRHPDGTARVFEIDNAEITYDGSLTQTLDISETTE